LQRCLLLFRLRVCGNPRYRGRGRRGGGNESVEARDLIFCALLLALLVRLFAVQAL
jgi:hypothetical protein